MKIEEATLVMSFSQVAIVFIWGVAIGFAGCAALVVHLIDG
jgi:hypothetical protein